LKKITIEGITMEAAGGNSVTVTLPTVPCHGSYDVTEGTFLGESSSSIDVPVVVICVAVVLILGLYKSLCKSRSDHTSSSTDYMYHNMNVDEAAPHQQHCHQYVSPQHQPPHLLSLQKSPSAHPPAVRCSTPSSLRRISSCTTLFLRQTSRLLLQRK
jgi:hypothetical protein